MEDVHITNQQVDEIINSIELTLNGKPLSDDNILRIVLACMTVTAQMDALPDKLKKLVVMTAFERFIDKSDLTENAKATLLIALHGVVASAIDLLSDISKHEEHVTSQVGQIHRPIAPERCCVIL